MNEAKFVHVLSLWCPEYDVLLQWQGRVKGGFECGLQELGHLHFFLELLDSSFFFLFLAYGSPLKKACDILILASLSHITDRLFLPQPQQPTLGRRHFRGLMCSHTVSLSERRWWIELKKGLPCVQSLSCKGDGQKELLGLKVKDVGHFKII